jgi:hypothetical protein
MSLLNLLTMSPPSQHYANYLSNQNIFPLHLKLYPLLPSLQRCYRPHARSIRVIELTAGKATVLPRLCEAVWQRWNNCNEVIDLMKTTSTWITQCGATLPNKRNLWSPAYSRLCVLRACSTFMFVNFFRNCFTLSVTFTQNRNLIEYDNLIFHIGFL